MSEFDLNALKVIIRDTLRTYLNSQCLRGTEEVKLSESVNYEVAQSFIPFSSCYNSDTPYEYTINTSIKVKKTGTPDNNLIISIQDSLNSLPSGDTLTSSTILVSEVSSTFSVLTKQLKIRDMLDSKELYWLVITPLNTASTINYYSITRDTVETNYFIGEGKIREIGSTFSALNGDIYFDIEIPEWIYESYPYEKLSIYSYPRIAIDFLSRPLVDEKCVDYRVAWYILNAQITVYSRYEDELDSIISLIDRIIFKERISMENFESPITPGNFTPKTTVRNLFVRSIGYLMRYRMWTV